ncbi:MAG: signal peptidase I [Coriobacteriia bacterium]|nr:signal peptidase I [Coriobacteriia bacterium]
MEEHEQLTEDKPSTASAPVYRGKHLRRRNLRREIIELLLIILAAFIITGLLRTFVMDNYQIPTGSMEPTIEINDRIFAEKVSYRFSSPSAGDIVTFHDPLVEGRVLIKRCIAVEGQTVDLINGKVVVNGVVLDEPYTHGLQSLPLTPKKGVVIDYPYVVPEGTIWVMGDNRTSSLDSRYFGPIPEEELIGRALFRFMPFSRFGPIK